MEISEKVKNLPNKPGCYLYLNQVDKVIYVGKAKNLKKRVTTYFNRAHDIKTTRLVREIADLKYFVVNNEKEALLLEENLIKKYRPKYNVLLNDDKAYPYIIITNEKNPQYKYVRNFDKKALRNYGPLPLGSAAREIMLTFQRLFPLRRCKGNLGHPCLNYHLNQCSGACFKKVPWSYYETQINLVDQFFKGQDKEIKRNLTQQMQTASDNLQFEAAQRIKNLLQSIDLVQDKNDVELNDSKNRDVLAYQIKNEKIALVLLFYRAGKLLFKDEVVINYEEQDVSELAASYLNQIYQKNILPNQIIIPDDLTFDYLTKEIKKLVTAPITKLEKNLFQLAQSNANETLRLAFLKGQSINHQEVDILEELQKMLGLKNYPQQIEMFDIANLANEFVTGSCIVYLNGQPSRNDFRKYNIDILEKDDLHRLQNMLYRRYQKALVEKRTLPDLIIMDGGMNQVHFAKQVLKSLDLNKIPVIGLVKDEHHTTNQIINLEEDQIKLVRRTPLYNFLSGMQIRVDRYAKSGYRQKQNAKLTTSTLSGIPGLGQKKIQALFKEFPTLNEMKKASIEELNKIVRNQKTTIKLWEFLNNKI